MKRMVTLLLALTFILMLGACGGADGGSVPASQPSEIESSQSNVQQSEPESMASKPESIEESASSEKMESPAEAESKDAAVKTLIVYFSCTNNTKNAAELIKEIVPEADLFEITPSEPYTEADLDYNTDCRANREQNDATARPAIANTVENMEDYDVIYVGYPIWWGVPPKIILSFLESYDFSGKTIVPFCTSGGSGYSDSGMAESAPGAALVTGGRLNGATADSVAEWINSLGL